MNWSILNDIENNPLIKSNSVITSPHIPLHSLQITIKKMVAYNLVLFVQNCGIALFVVFEVSIVPTPNQRLSLV